MDVARAGQRTVTTWLRAHQREMIVVGLVLLYGLVGGFCVALLERVLGESNVPIPRDNLGYLINPLGVGMLMAAGWAVLALTHTEERRWYIVGPLAGLLFILAAVVSYAASGWGPQAVWALREALVLLFGVGFAALFAPRRVRELLIGLAAGAGLALLIAAFYFSLEMPAQILTKLKSFVEWPLFFIAPLLVVALLSPPGRTGRSVGLLVAGVLLLVVAVYLGCEAIPDSIFGPRLSTP